MSFLGENSKRGQSEAMWDRCFAQDFVSVVTCGMGYTGMSVALEGSVGHVTLSVHQGLWGAGVRAAQPVP